MYNIFYCDLQKLSNKSLDEIYLGFSRNIKEKIDSKKDPLSHKQSIAGYMLAKRYASSFCGVSPEKIEFAFGQNGKPYIINQNVHFNISHSHNYVVVAVANEPVGVDVEEIREFSAIVAQKKFTKDEIEYISESGKKTTYSMQKAFYEIWTAKEAYLKYLGKGLSYGINSLCLKSTKNGLITNKQDIKLKYDLSIPDVVIAVITGKQR